MVKSKVLLVGAAGETGRCILDGLLEYGQDDVIALVRPASLEKASVQKLKQRGVEVRVGDIGDPIDTLVKTLGDIDTLISILPPGGQLAQVALADAAKKAGVKRYIPCGFITVAPPGGVMTLRDDKEVVYQHIRRIGLGYTFVDCGYWYQISFPKLPSGRLDDKILLPITSIYGTGEVKNGITDERDIGRYVARIIHDERTLNKYVFFFGAVVSQHETIELLEELSGEKIERKYVSAEELESQIAESKKTIAANPDDRWATIGLYGGEYNYSKFIRGDNTPEYAKYLGYLDASELYPDFKPIGWREFLVDLLAGKTERPYPDGINLG
jgi:uncharacterized protein YbjT (DUF2867 family)